MIDKFFYACGFSSQFVTARIANKRSLAPLQGGIKPPGLRPPSAGANLRTSLAPHTPLVTSFTPVMFSTKLFAAFATVAAAATAVGAVSAAITAPAQGDLWTVGASKWVMWDTVDLASVDATGRILLGYNSTPDDKRPHLQVGPLATGVDLKAGTIEVTVPDVTPGDKYVVTLAIGDSDVINVSEEFTIAKKD
ncbi:hypothetical protein BD413DRAFT_560504 [Trametes elegans]|nr:hypothetical protein BD413DRAFT_560504 [Trametes elegans]